MLLCISGWLVVKITIGAAQHSGQAIGTLVFAKMDEFSEKVRTAIVSDFFW